MTREAIDVAPVIDWDDAVTVMGARGDPAGCWCQFFRQTGNEFKQSTRESKRIALQIQVEDDPLPPGVIAHVEGEAVGWCAVAPKSSYPRVLRSPVTGSQVDDVWSVTCFVVKVGWRRRGVGGALLEGAVGLAQSHGAQVVEGYPIDPERRKSISSAELYHGTVNMFLQAGFEEVSRPTESRVLTRLTL